MFTLEFEFERFVLVIIKYVKSDVGYVFLFLLFWITRFLYILIKNIALRSVDGT